MDNINYIALSQQSALQRQMEVIANNIANMSTPGYKAENMLFREYMAPTEGGQKISYVQDLGVATDLSQGPIAHTGYDYDFAIEGEGYFVIGAAAGNRYTRNGHFRLDANGQIVNANNDPLLSDSGTPMVVPSAASKVTLNRDGSLYADDTLIGKVKLIKFEKPQMLEREEGGLYREKDPSLTRATPVQNAQILQASIEQSNVSGVVEMSRMMQVSRSYESTQNIVNREDDRVRQAIRRITQAQ